MDKSPTVSNKSVPSYDPSTTTDQHSAERYESVVARLCRALLQRLSERKTRIMATYRMQLHGKGFRLLDATQRVPYLSSIGVSHLYSSPLFKAQSGSIHGYDVIDPTELNDELGSWSDFDQLVQALHAHDLGHVLDIVPNHMSVANDENKWWMDVLKHGPASRYAKYFDIDWHPVRGNMAGRILLPLLDAASGEVLEAGRLAIRFRTGAFYAEYNHSLFPLAPKTWIELLMPGLESLGGSSDRDTISHDVIELYSIIAALRNLPARDAISDTAITERYHETIVVEQRLDALVQKSTQIAEHISANLRTINGQVGYPRSFDRLDQLLEQQPYRLVHWKASSDEINYRRFFDVSTLAALSIENFDVFEATHRAFFEIAAAGKVDACRVDHVDGLYDPGQYLWRLQWHFLLELGKQIFDNELQAAQGAYDWQRVQADLLARLHEIFGGRVPEELISEQSKVEKTGGDYSDASGNAAKQLPLAVYVEKILGADEPLPSAWPVCGTTGYDYMNLLNGLFVEPDGLNQLRKTYDRFVGNQFSFDDIVYECKRLILSGPMQSEVTLLASRLDRIAKSSRYSRDFTLNALEFAIQEIIACFAVYRTYIHDGHVSPRDEQVVQRATAMAKRRNPAIETNTFDFVRDVLLLKEPHDLSEKVERERDYLVGRFQQVTSPVQAKGVEDTAFYRYIPLLSVEEVGGEPRHAIVTTEQFHQQNIHRHQHWPHSMIATTTHDTKRSEDVRARLNVLAESPGLWRKSLQRWQRLNRKHIRQVDGHEAPCRNDQWLFYQTLVGIWPVSPPTDDERKQLIERVTQYMEKATHEAKLHTSWVSPNPPYDAAVKQFIQTVLADPQSKFGIDLQEFVDGVLDSGLVNAASQVLIKLTSPGVPDIYQGQELWDFSLVDPDNRRPVDYDLRHHLLGEIQQNTSQTDSRLAFARYLKDHPRDNRFKMFVTLEALAFRKRLGTTTEELRYVPLRVTGPAAEHVIAFAWHRVTTTDVATTDDATTDGDCVAIVIAPRFAYKHSQLEEGWVGTVIEMSSPAHGSWINQFTGALVAVDVHSRLHAHEILQDFPLALLTRDSVNSSNRDHL